MLLLSAMRSICSALCSAMLTAAAICYVL